MTHLGANLNIPTSHLNSGISRRFFSEWEMNRGTLLDWNYVYHPGYTAGALHGTNSSKRKAIEAAFWHPCMSHLSMRDQTTMGQKGHSSSNPLPQHAP